MRLGNILNYFFHSARKKVCIEYISHKKKKWGYGSLDLDM